MLQSKKLWLLRHGEPEGGDGRIRGQSDDPLTEKGWQQLEAVVQNLVVDCVYTSPLQRCRAFAEQYAQAQQLPWLVEPRLIEMGMGSWEGLAKKTVLAGTVDLWRYAQSPQSQLPSDAEPFSQIEARVGSWLQEFRQCDAERVLVVAHAGIIRFILAALLDMPIESALRIKLPFAACLSLTVQWDESRMLGQLHWSA